MFNKNKLLIYIFYHHNIFTLINKVENYETS